MPKRLSRSGLTAALALLLVLAACSGGSSPKTANQAAPAITEAPQAAPATVPATTATTATTVYPTFTTATATVPEVEVFDDPGQAQSSKRLENPDPWYGVERVFLVREHRGDWLKVMLPVRPNESTGWIRASDVELAQHEYRMVIDVPGRKLTAYKGSDVFVETPVAVGSPSTPTPGGLFYTTQAIEVLPEQRSAYGPYAFGLSAYSDVLFDFAGGDGQVGIHGTADTGSIGRNVSNGCIRLPNEEITKLAETLPLGVPVEIKV